MGSIDSYIFRQTFAAFLLVLVTLTGVIWLTQALRGIDVMTSQGQTVLVFIGLTGLAIPYLVLVIAPIALVIAVAYVLNKLSTDSEIIVMNAAGMQPWRLFRPFLLVTVIVSAMIFATSAYIAPDGLRRLKAWQREITADVLSNVLQTGKFVEIERNLTLRVRERQPGGLLVGIFIDDRRNPKERVTIIAERGTVLKNERGSFLILDDGNLQRFEAGRRDPAFVAFDRNAFDMSKIGGNTSTNVTYSIRERYLWDLLDPDPDDPMFKQFPGQFRAEMHERLTSPLYPFAFMALTFAFLGAPRTTRQSRAMSISSAIVSLSTLRLIGFACTVLAATSIFAAPFQYALLFATLAFSAWVIARVIVLEPPPVVIDTLSSMVARVTRRFAAS
ncbi:LPS export ABC transporter permease LptF [Bradyrhizobium sp. LHD-71]|uniref:LPS export ABC transporter permease LptF n=1 Tax=Bradyrhizobium sp. LHD-71 TaxID=3072141 RepID=UPI00280C7160|nr:LPS export ABC transporter permease LptF [Bradyrhizobium sp. LHD-71]MDQ8729889.1 LPS export ABC transporter permease LptF [Bradyrhizobium sp. LHD-71]